MAPPTFILLILSILFSLFQDGKYLRLMRRGDDRVLFRHIDVDLRANTEFTFQINARLNGECRPWDQRTGIARFEVINICAVAVAFLADRMAGAMEELIGVAGFSYYASGDIVHFRSADHL